MTGRFGKCEMWIPLKNLGFWRRCVVIRGMYVEALNQRGGGLGKEGQVAISELHRLKRYIILFIRA
jgi:hypothetical protein